MKKHPILTIFLSILVFFLIYGVFLARDIFRIKNFYKDTEASRSSRVKVIGISGLCERKRIDFDDKKQEIEKSLKNLTAVTQDFLEFHFEGRTRAISKIPFRSSKFPDEKELTPSKFEYFMDNLRILDDNFKFSSIKDYEWNITDPELSKELNHPMVNTTIYPSNELCNIINLIALMDIYDKEKFKILDSSTLFTSMLKVHLFSLYTNKGLSATRESEHNLDGLYFFYDKLIDNEYSEDEMKKMLASIKEVIPLIPDIRDNFIIQYDFTKRLYDFSFSEFPVIANTLKLFLGNPYSELEKMMGEFKEGKFKEASSHFNKHQLLLIFVTPEMTSFNSTYNDNIDVNSRLALFQAYLEDRLGKEITAIDPFDGQPVRSTINDGKKTFYCLGHDGKDEKGLGNNITNCDSELKIQIKKYKDREDEKRKNANK